MLKFKRIFEGKNSIIAIYLYSEKNHTYVNLVNQVLVSKPNTIKKKNICEEKQYAIRDLQLTIDDYKLISEFHVTFIYLNKVDIVIGSLWMEMLRTFILNMKKMVLAFC